MNQKIKLISNHNVIIIKFKIMNIALVGCGSIGSRYKENLTRNYPYIENFYIIDNNKEVVQNLRKEGFKSFLSINEFIEEKINISHGIVANWGPDHLDTANKLIDQGCKKLIIEKPLSSRKDQLQIFKKRCMKENIFVTVHHHWKYTNISELIKNTQEDHALGKPVGVRLIGGAVCLSTNGTHAFDLSCEILETIPKSITSDLELDYINPRDKKLINIGGMASYKMKNNTFIHVSLTNTNSEALIIEFVYRNASIKLLSDSSLNLYKRDENDIKKFGDKITRYGELNFIKEIEFEDRPTVGDVLKNLIEDKSPKVSIQDAEIPVLMVLGALESHQKSKRILFDNINDTGILIS